MTRAANPNLPRKILDEAEQIVVADGYESINMRKLASRVGVTATTVYHYFESKEELLLQLKLRAAERLNDSIRRIEDDPEPGRVIEQLGRVYIGFAEEYPNLYRFLFEAPLGGLPLGPTDTPVLYHTYHVARGALERMHGAGGFTPQGSNHRVRPEYGAMMGWMMLHGFCSLLLSGTLQPAEGLNSEQLKEIFMQFYVHGGPHKVHDEGRQR